MSGVQGPASNPNPSQVNPLREMGNGPTGSGSGGTPAATYSHRSATLFKAEKPELEAPAPGALNNFSTADLIFVQSAMGVSVMKTMSKVSLDSAQKAQQLRKEKAEEQIQKIEEANRKAAEAASAGKTANIFSWAVTGLSFVAGVALCCVPGGAILGGPLIFGAIVGATMNVFGDKIIEAVASGLEAMGMEKSSAQLLATVIVIVATVALCMLGPGAAVAASARLGTSLVKNLPRIGQILAKTAPQAALHSSRTTAAAVNAGVRVPETVFNLKASFKNKSSAENSAQAIELRAESDQLQSIVESAINSMETFFRTIQETVTTSLRSIQTDLQPRRISA